MAEKIGNYDFLKIEEEILQFWQDKAILEKARKKNKGKQKFFFIQGPPYTSGQIHMGHAWNNALKDMVLRFKRMKGLDVFDRAAYDMHGLPTAHKVQEKFGIKLKDDIPKFGVEKFIKECINFSTEKAELMNKDLTRLGVSMDFENACLPINNSYIEGVWYLIKKTNESKRLYEGLKTMSWCASCATAMAKHECEYKEVTDDSIFVKFPIKGKEKEYLIIWTTTPWTLAFNLAIMVHPELEYVKAKVGDEIWILAKGLAAPVVQAVANEKMEIIDELLGKDLEGLEYVHPWGKYINQFKEIKAKHPKTHTVLLSEEYVNLSAGTGLVHCAPGCGPEDYEVGHRNNIPPFNSLREDGVFPEDMGIFAGLKAKTDDKKFVEQLEKDGLLIAVSPVEHDYAHCERCRNPVIFRTTKQWFFKVEDLKEKMLEGNEKVHWVPETAKNAFRSWLENLRDNSITKQRYWGTPAPIWKCGACSKYDAIGSALELKDKAGHVPENLHKPWIDEVEINCECGAMMKRIPDVLDVWIDAGTLSWNILDYPGNKELYNELWPADFILEAKEQIRGWFNLLMVSSILAFDDPYPFKACYMHGMLSDVEGVKMSKSLGNVISPYEMIDKYGVDTLRAYTTQTTAGEDMNFSWDEAKLKNRNLTVLWNIHKLLVDLSRQNGFKPKDVEDLKKAKLNPEDSYMLSRLHSTIKEVSEMFELYRLDRISPVIEKMFLDLSRTYIQIIRDKSATGSKEEKKRIFSIMYTTVMETLKILTPVCPFIAEKIYLNLKQEYGLKEESVSLLDWPKAEEKLIDKNLEKDFEIAQATIQSILYAREKIQRGVRWPLKEALIVTNNGKVIKAINALQEIIKNQTNVKEIGIKEQMENLIAEVKADFAKLGPEFGDKSPKIIAQLTTMSPEAILNKIKKEGKCELDIDGEKIHIKEKHLIIKKEVPDPYVEADYRFGELYINEEVDKELEKEGFAREIMRRVQNLRKTAGLQKTDDIILHIKTVKDGVEILKGWEENIKEKVGASELTVSEKEPSKKLEHNSKEKIKGKEFELFLSKL